MFNLLFDDASVGGRDKKAAGLQGQHLNNAWQTNWICFSILVVIALSLALWVSFDHSIPCWDTAAHKLNSFKVYQLLRHPHLSHLYWYRNIFAVSPLYPPLYYFVSALLKFIAGAAVNTEFISNLIFMTVLFFSLNYAAQAVSKDKLTGILCGCLVFLYPAVYWSAHIASLDFAAIAMVALGLACFLWWADIPNTRKSIVLGLVLGLAALTKNNTPIFFIGPILTDLIFALLSKDRKKCDYARIKQLAIVAASSFIVILPWLILAGPTVVKFIASIQQQNFHLNSYSSGSTDLASNLGTSSWIADFVTHCQWFTLQDLPVILSPLFCGCFLIALVTSRPFNRNTIYLLAAIICSIIAASAFRWPHQFRYIVPVVAPMAILTTQMFAQMWQSHRTTWRLALATIIFIGILQFIYDAWCPYPLHSPAWTKIIMQALGEDFKMHVGLPEVSGVSVNPLPENDWGTVWALLAIEASGGRRPTSLMIVPGCDEINCSSYYYLTKVNNNGIEVATPRQHTETGDLVQFDPKLATWYEWYILKTGNQGRQMYNSASMAAYSQWCEFVRNKKLYMLVKTKLLPDGSTMELYRKVIKTESQP